jgi:hypothetical protein
MNLCYPKNLRFLQNHSFHLSHLLLMFLRYRLNPRYRLSPMYLKNHLFLMTL